MDYRIGCLLSIFKREFDEIEKSAVAVAPASPTSTTPRQTETDTSTAPPTSPKSTTASSVSSSTFIDHHYHKSIDLERVGIQAEGIFGERYIILCNEIINNLSIYGLF